MAVELISKIKPKNNGTFPLVDAADVEMPDGTRLSDFEGGVTSVNGQTGDVVITVTDGKDGEDGYTPVKGVDYFDGKDGKDGSNGADGKNGEDGKDGVSPTISVTAITGGHRVSITDANGTKTFDVMDGEDGNAASVTIDTTLTKAGQAADAKVVGNMFATATADFEKALQHLAPLIGTTETVTPADVHTALTEGQQVVLTHTEEDLGKVTFNSFAVLDDSMVAAHATATMEGVAANMTLLGTVAEGVWNLALVQIPSTEVFQPYLLPDVTTKDNGKLLQVVDGAWTAVAMTDVSEVGM